MRPLRRDFSYLGISIPERFYYVIEFSKWTQVPKFKSPPEMDQSTQANAVEYQMQSLQSVAVEVTWLIIGRTVNDGTPFTRTARPASRLQRRRGRSYAKI